MLIDAPFNSFYSINLHNDLNRNPPLRSFAPNNGNGTPSDKAADLSSFKLMLYQVQQLFIKLFDDFERNNNGSNYNFKEFSNSRLLLCNFGGHNNSFVQDMVDDGIKNYDITLKLSQLQINQDRLYQGHQNSQTINPIENFSNQSYKGKKERSINISIEFDSSLQYEKYYYYYQDRDGDREEEITNDQESISYGLDENNFENIDMFFNIDTQQHLQICNQEQQPTVYSVNNNNNNNNNNSSKNSSNNNNKKNNSKKKANHFRTIIEWYTPSETITSYTRFNRLSSKSATFKSNNKSQLLLNHR